MSRQFQDLDPIDSAEVEIADLLAVEDVSVPKTKRLTIGDLAIAIQKLNYPVNSLYFNAEDSTDPAVLLGFGTWVRHGEGRAIVSQKDGDAHFGTAGQLSGVTDVTLTADQIPSHSHSVNPPSTSTSSAGAHTHSYRRPPAQKILPIHGSGDSAHGFNDSDRSGTTGSAGAHSHTVDIPAFNSSSVGGGQSHTNVQPSIAVYVWKRTA